MHSIHARATQPYIAIQEVRYVRHDLQSRPARQVFAFLFQLDLKHTPIHTHTHMHAHICTHMHKHTHTNTNTLRHCKERAHLLQELHSVRARHEALVNTLGLAQRQEEAADAMARRYVCVCI
jgi:hypothetical protein